MVKRVVTPGQAAAELRAHIGEGRACGILFGPERAGLLNDHVVLSDTVISVPLNPAFSSLNLAQAVLLIGYEWFTAGDATPASEQPTGDSAPASKKSLISLFEHLEQELDRNGSLGKTAKRPRKTRNLRNPLPQAPGTEQGGRT